MVRNPIAAFDVFMKDGRYAANQHSLTSYLREFFNRQKKEIKWICIDVVEEGKRHSWTSENGWETKPITETRRATIEQRTHATLNREIFNH